jgi:flavin-binding protein dodecin
MDDAIKNAVEESAKKIRNLQWAELGRTTLRIENYLHFHRNFKQRSGLVL